MTMLSCCTNKPEPLTDQIAINTNLIKNLDSVFRFPKNKKVGVYWTLSIGEGYFRRIFLKVKVDSFRQTRKIDEELFTYLEARIFDEAKFAFNDGEKINGIRFFKNISDNDSLKKYFLIEASASPLIARKNGALMYVEATDIFHHIGIGSIWEFKEKDGKMQLSRSIPAWTMWNDSIYLSVFH